MATKSTVTVGITLRMTREDERRLKRAARTTDDTLAGFARRTLFAEVERVEAEAATAPSPT